MTTRLFVYGTLAPGRSNESQLSDLAGSWQPATVSGQLVDQGWGASQGYPGLILSAQGSPVDGFVLTSCELPEHWARLDAFEGEGYRRRLTNANLDSGESVPVYVYELAPGSAETG